MDRFRSPGSQQDPHSAQQPRTSASRWKLLSNWVHQRRSTRQEMGCTHSVPVQATNATPAPLAKPEPLELPEPQASSPATDLVVPEEVDTPQSTKSQERVRSMRLDRPASTRKLSTASLPQVEPAPASPKPVSIREQVQQLFAAIRLKEAGYLSVGESKSNGSGKNQPVTQALAACSAVLKRMEDHEALSELVEFNLPQAVVATMRHFQLAASVQAACYEIIERMIEGSVFNKDRLRLAGVCPALASSLLQILDEKETLVAGLDCMLLLMTENMQNVIAMGNAGAHSLLVTAMATHADDIEVQSLGCICIQHLGRHGPTSLALGKVGVCARVTHAFKFVEQLSVILHQTVATLCMQPSNIVEFGNAALCEVLVRLMHDKPEAATLQGLLLPMIQQLGRDETNRKRLHTAGVCDSLITVHLQHPSLVFIQEHFCETVFVLAQDDSISTDLGNAAACESILQMMRRLSHYPQMHYLCCIALYSLSHTTANYQRLGQTGALQQIQRALDQFDASAAAALAGTPTPSKKNKGSRKLGPNVKGGEDNARVQSVKYLFSKMGHLRMNRANSTNSSVDFGSDSVQSHEVLQQPQPDEYDAEHHEGSDSEDEEEEEPAAAEVTA